MGEYIPVQDPQGTKVLSMPRYNLFTVCVQILLLWSLFFLLAHRTSPDMARLTAFGFDSCVLMGVGTLHEAAFLYNRCSVLAGADVLTASWASGVVLNSVLVVWPLSLFIANLDCLFINRQFKMLIALLFAFSFCASYAKIRYFSTEWSE